MLSALVPVASESECSCADSIFFFFSCGLAGPLRFTKRRLEGKVGILWPISMAKREAMSIQSHYSAMKEHNQDYPASNNIFTIRTIETVRLFSSVLCLQ
jgi:hypothetical protein